MNNSLLPSRKISDLSVLVTASKFRITTIALIIANLIPIYCVLFLGWKVFTILFLFWFENLVIGFYNILKILANKPTDATNWIAKLFMLPFFSLHYGIFTLVHGVFVIAMFGHEQFSSHDFPDPLLVLQILKQNNLLIPILAIFISHGLSYLINYIGKKEFTTTTLTELMGKPYARVVILHLVILIGGILVLVLHLSLAGLFLLVILKILLDMRLHRKEHQGSGGKETGGVSQYSQS